MILGMSLGTFTLVHVLISLVAIAAGLIAMVGLLTSNPLRGWTALFLLLTILTSITGFFFPFATLLPSHIVGIISLVLLCAALVALYVRHLAGFWRRVYIVTAILALYLNVFVLIVQAFQKVGPLQTLAPTQTEPPFLVAQGAALVVFGLAIIIALRRFHPAQRYA
ncbi:MULTISPECIES: hypothetical protein [Rhodopseudomonas]|uniref:Membrane protein n=1 Tax=Rhodopseudomonas palustris TaxID=1076 RepID=A0A0D7EHV6_RHOPL|nr:MULTISPECIES: hypothetical protein [Rhodopseudomonas]KIZ40226.1 membrane protein [Rhodopseudomonas palustris]WOK15804.1 hypothetical protein RBJ75_16680 [Rhodopseudomonas sp. BAL398]